MDSCKCHNRSAYIESCCFNPVIFFVCKLCRGAFENADKLILHKRQHHSLKDLKGIKFIIFEERFIKTDDNTHPNGLPSTVPKIGCVTADNSSDINSVVSPLPQDDSPPGPDPNTDIVIDVTDDSEKNKLHNPYVLIKRLTSIEIKSYSRTGHSYKNQENENFNATNLDKIYTYNEIKNDVPERELLEVIPEKELTRKSAKKSDDADTEQLRLNLDEALGGSHAKDDSFKTGEKSDFEDLDTFALTTEIDSNDAPNSPEPGPALPVSSLTETEAQDKGSNKNYNSESTALSVQVTTPKIHDSSQTETLAQVSPPSIDRVRSLRSRSKINYSENQTCAECNRNFYTVENLKAHEKVCTRYKSNREQSRKRDLLQTTVISDNAAGTTHGDIINEIEAIQKTAISPNPIDLEVKVTDGAGDQDHAISDTISSSRDSDFDSSRGKVNVTTKKVITGVIPKDALQPVRIKTEKPENYTDCPLSLKDWIRKEKDNNPENIILLDPNPFQAEADINKKVETPAYVATPENPIKCMLCSKQLTSDLIAKRHLKCCWTKNKTNHVHCPMCSKSYSTPSGLYRHRKAKHLKPGERPLSFKCTICSKELVTKLGFQYHIEIHKNPNLKPFVCEICGSGFRHKYKLQYHQLSHLEDRPRPFKCKLCPKAFKSKEVLRKHQVAHAKSNNYHCLPCNKSFKTKEVLRRHSSYHLKDKWHPCKAEHCDLKFPFKPSLWTHYQKDHKELYLQMAKLSCTVCSKKFMMNCQLERHMFSHGRERPFKCSEEGCNGTFTTKQNWEEHCRKHTGERPYQCDQCGSTFARSTLFYIHLKQHKHPKVRVLCHLCPKTFSRNWELQQHLTFHEKGRQFSCEKCHLKFMSKANLKGHMKIHERKDAIDDGSSCSSSSESEVESEEGTTEESEPESK